MGYAACFSDALSAVARKRSVVLSTVEVACSVSLHRWDDAYSLSFDIVARLPGIAAAEADKLVAEAHTFCPCSRAFDHDAPAQARAAPPI
jgi:organic hydroperoxide reductase OsmC/OhrA